MINALGSYHLNLEQNIKVSTKVATKQTSSLVLGYKVDKDGYFTDEFNKQAGIPIDYKIHSSTLESLVRSNDIIDPDIKNFKSIDIAKTVGNAYRLLAQVVGEDTLNSKESFSTDDISNFPQGFSYDRQSLQVDKRYASASEYSAVEDSFVHTPTKTISTLFYNGSLSIAADKQIHPKNVTYIFNNANGGKENTVIGIFMDPHGEKYTNKDGSVTKGGLIAGVLNHNLDIYEGETTAIGKYGGYDKSINTKEFQRSFNAFNAMWQMAYGVNFSKADDGAVSMLPDYMQDYVRHRQSLDKFSDQEDELSFKKMMEHNLKMLKLLFGEIDKDGKKSKDFMDSFLKFSMPPLNLIKELNENPAGKYLVDMLGIKRDVDIKA